MRLVGVCRYERLEIIVRRGAMDAGGAWGTTAFQLFTCQALAIEGDQLDDPRIASCSCKGPLAYVTLASLSSVGLFVHGAL
jgi:hypothetical protein